MRNTILSAVFLLAVPVAALAQAPPPVPLAPINCDALNTGTFICIRNGTSRPIVKITCSGFWGASDMSIPHGIIQSGETTIVDFTAGKCSKHIVVFTRDGHQYPFDGFDTKNNTSLLVDNE
jgi:hypothetical protein